MAARQKNDCATELISSFHEALSSFKPFFLPLIESAIMQSYLFFFLMIFITRTSSIPFQSDYSPANEIVFPFEDEAWSDDLYLWQEFEPHPHIFSESIPLFEDYFPVSDPLDFSPFSSTTDYTDPFPLLLAESDDTDMLLSDSGSEISCPLGKKRETDICAANIASPELEIPDFPGVFEDAQSDAIAVPYPEQNKNPCLANMEYPLHVCCLGPSGTMEGVEYSVIEQCLLGMFFYFPSKRKDMTWVLHYLPIASFPAPHPWAERLSH
jgi:hypothetical protein